MGFNYASERKKFEQEWAKFRKEYEAAGMPSESIQLLYEFDLRVFRSQRTYEKHTQEMPSEYIEDDKTGRSRLLCKFKQTSVTFDESDFRGRYAWIDGIENQQLVRVLRQLTDMDLELLTFLVLEEHTQCELAQKWGCSQKAVSRRFLKIKKLFQNIK